MYDYNSALPMYNVLIT